MGYPLEVKHQHAIREVLIDRYSSQYSDVLDVIDMVGDEPVITLYLHTIEGIQKTLVIFLTQCEKCH